MRGKRATKIFDLIAIISLIWIVFGSAVVSAEMPTFVSDQGVYIQDTLSGHVMYAQNENKQMSPASMTKLMTALVAMDYVTGSLDARVTVGEEIKQIDADSSVAHFDVGDSYTWSELLNGLLLPSGNDAAMTIAVNCAKIAQYQEISISDAVNVFVGMMNTKAANLGLQHTHFVNPHGLYSADHYTTPKEMAVIVKAAMKNETIKNIVSTKQFDCVSGNGVAQKWFNSNMLIHPSEATMPETARTGEIGNSYYRASAIGGKTGFTEEVGHNLAFMGDNGEIQIIAVVMGAANNKTLYPQCDRVLDEIERYTHVQWAEEKGCYDWKLPFLGSIGSGLIVKANTKDAVYSTVLKDYAENVVSEVEWKEELFGIAGPFARIKSAFNEGDVIAEIAVYNGTECIDRIPLYASNTMEPAGVLEFFIAIFIFVLILVLIICVINTKRRKKARSRERAGEIKRAAINYAKVKQSLERSERSPHSQARTNVSEKRINNKSDTKEIRK